jgi:DNA-binding transcriptional LysR family regulator
MNLRQLRYFVVLAEELHFRRAAERLNMTQSPLTLAIQELEREVGGRLLHRTQRRVELTEAGTAFLADARAILEKVQGSLEATRGLLRGECGQLRLGLSPAAALLPFLALAIDGFRRGHPDVRLVVRELSSVEQLRALQIHELDVCVMRMPVSRRPSAVGSIKLLRDRLVVAMHREHPLGKRPWLAIADLKDEHFILSPPCSGVGICEIVFQLCAKRSFAPRIAHEVRDVATVIGLTAARLGIAIVPSELLRIDMPEILLVPLIDADAATDIYMAYRDDERNPRVTSLCRIAQDAVTQIQPAALAVGRAYRSGQPPTA